MEENGKLINQTNELKTKIESLQAENKSLNEQLKSFNGVSEENQKTINELNTTIEELNGKLSAYELTNLKTQVAINHGIPYNLANRLQGSTEEELKADAQNLSSFISKNEPIAPLKDTESKVSVEKGAYKNLLTNLNLEGE